MPFNRILLAITDEGQRELYQESLQEEGFSVQAAGDGEEAFDLFQIEGGDVVVAEAGLPGMGGVELLRRIRELNEYCGVVLVAGSDDDLDEHDELLARLGARDVLRKPFNVITLLCAIEARVEAMRVREAEVLQDSQPSPDLKLRELEIKVEDYRSKVRDLTRELGLREGLEEKLENLRALVREKEKELFALREDVNRGREDLDRNRRDYEGRVDLYQKTIDGMMKENRKLLEDFEKRVIHHTKQLELLSTDSETVSSTYEKRLAELGTELEILRGQNEELSRERASLSSLKDDFERSAHEKLADRDSSFAAEREALMRTAAAKDEAIKALETEVAQATSRLRSLELEREELTREHAEKLEQLKRSHEQSLTEVRSEVGPERKKVQTLLDFQQTILKNLFSGFLSVDNREKITATNQQTGDLLGIPLGRLIGERLSALPELEPTLPYFRNAIENGDDADDVPLTLRRGDGSEFPVRFRCRRVRFGARDMCLILLQERVVAPEAAEAPAAVDAVLESNPIYAFGASAAADIVDLKDQLLGVRNRIEKIYALTQPDTPMRETVNLLLNDVGDTLDFIKSVTDRAEQIMA